MHSPGNPRPPASSPSSDTVASSGRPTACVSTDQSTDQAADQPAGQSTGLSANPLRFLADHVPAMIAHVDAEARYLFVNTSYAERFGLTPEEIAGRRVDEVVGEAAFDTIRPHLEACLAGREVTWDADIRYQHLGARCVHVFYTPDRALDGRVQGVLAVIHDVTDQRRAEALTQANAELEARVAARSAELTEVAERLRLFVEHAPAALAMFDRQMRYLSVSRRWRQDYRLGETELLGRSHDEVFPDVPEHWKRIYQRGLAGEVIQVEKERFRRADGSVQWLRWEVRPWRDASNEVGGIVLFTEDITARVAAEQALLERGTELREAQRVAHVGSWHWDASTDVTTGSDELLRIYGLDPATERLPNFRDQAGVLYPHASWRRLNAAVEQALATGVGYALELEALRKGEPIWIVTRSEVVRDDAGRIVALRGTVQDITERKRAEQAVQESEERFRALADTIAQLAWMADGAGHIFWYNRRWYEYTGTTLEEMEGWGWKSVHHPDHLDRVVERWSAHLKAGAYWEDTFPLRGTDGQYRRFLSRAYPIRDETGRVVRWCGTNTDVEDLERAEETARSHLAEIEALNVRLRRAMSETHHRVKNNLQVITGMVDLQAMQHEAAVPVVELRRIARHVQSLAVLHDLLTQQARSEADVEFLSVREALDRLMPLVRELAGARAMRIRVDDLRLSIRQSTSLTILINELLSNAVKHGAGEVELSLCAEGERVQLEVCDDGPGFPAGFDPEQSANTGLHLVESLARWDLQGSTRYENRASGGARVVVEFPLTLAGKGRPVNA